MSQTIGGIDLTLETPAASFDLRTVLNVLLDFWPAAQFQDANASSAQPLRAVTEGESGPSSTEFFVYRDQDSAASWADDGSTPENANTMVHCLVQRVGNEVQLTLVVDRMTEEMLRLYHDVSSLLEALRRAKPKRGLPRMNLDRELKAAGVGLDREQFGQLLEELLDSLYPGWTDEELACHPHDALQFCGVVRDRVDAQVPDHVIMKALTNRRRRR